MDPQSILKELPQNPSMRDINDVCVRYGIPTLAQGMIEFPPPTVLRSLVGEVAMRDGIHTYRQRFGEPDYRQAVSSMVKKQYGEDLSVDQILATQGVTGGIVATLLESRAAGRPTRVGLFSPFYTYHLFQIQTAVGKDRVIVDSLPLSKDGIDWAVVEPAIAQKGFDVVLICNPSNPLGVVVNEHDMRRLIGCCAAARRGRATTSISDKYEESPLSETASPWTSAVPDKPTTLLVDECYVDMVWSKADFWSPAALGSSLPRHVVIARGFSKVLGAQSWRVGYAIASPDVVVRLMHVADPVYLCVPWLQHVVAQYLTEHYDDFAAHAKSVGVLMRENWAKLAPALEARLGWKRIEPSGSMYGNFTHSEADDWTAVAKALAAGVGVCPGCMFVQPPDSNLETPLGSEIVQRRNKTGFVRIHCGISAAKVDLILSKLKS